MNLIICNTSYQLLTALNISVNLLNVKETDIMISDHFESKEICENLMQMKLFRNVIYIETDQFNRTDKYKNQYLKRIMRMQNRKNSLKHTKGNDLKYDRFYFNNIDWYNICLFAELKKINPNITAHQYEDGYSTYTLNPITLDSMWKRTYYNALGISALFNSISEVLVYDPNLVCVDLNNKINTIPKIKKDDWNFVNICNRTFNILKYCYQQKYVFFEESFQADHIRNNDIEIIKLVRKLVGDENFIVKAHPRNRINRFEEIGIKYSKVSFPWEIYALNNDLHDKTLISIFSGSIISPKIVFDDDSKVIFLYKLLEGDHMTVNKDKFQIYVDKLLMLYGDRIFIPNSVDELNKMLS